MKAVTSTLALVTIVWLLAPAVAIWLLEDHLLKTTVEPQSHPVWVPVNVDAVPTSRAATINLQWMSGQRILTPAWSGTVQSVLKSPGNEVRSGEVLLIIDGIGRMALHTPTPFFGSLKFGDSGPEVQKLNRSLVDLGYGSALGADYGSDTIEAVRRLKLALGDSRGDAREVSASLFVYLPVPSITIESITVQAGSMAPASGSEIIIGRRQLTAATLNRPNARGDLQDVTQLQDSSGRSATTEENTSATEFIPLVADPDEDLYVADTAISLTDDRAGASLSSLLAIPEVTAGKTSRLDATLKRRFSNTSFRIPSAALFAGESGATCVHLMRAGIETNEDVHILSTDVGSTVVSGELVTGDQLLLAPRTEDRICP
ncbi:hypothetical protein OHC50_12610 [Paenarthrobacter ilicis]|uniref:peptidoglycan-binding domain-containing protein n=1 Tax=Paenarthrobacter ilicis TaxID=43665 RepID=UPI0030099764